jgi:hypothetical protein
MRLARSASAAILGALAATGLLLAPALRAQDDPQAPALAKRLALSPRGSLGAFTPAAADPKLAAILARSGLPESGFHFTPSESRRADSRGVTVAVRARSTRSAARAPIEASALTPAISLAPIAYNLGVSVGWKRFAVSGDVTKLDLVTQPGGRERTDIGVSYTGKRASGRISANTDKPLANTPVLIGDKPSYSIDVGGSYALTRNFAVTAGLRYRSETERDRLPHLDDNNSSSRRDSQAVYVGTAFRF